MTLLEQYPQFAQAFADNLSKTPAAILRAIFNCDGEIYITIQKIALPQPDGSTKFAYAPNIFTGPFAERDAKEHCADPDDMRDPAPDYVETIVLHPDGTYTFKYQFRL